MNYDLNFLTAQTYSPAAFQVGYLYIYLNVFVCVYVCLHTGMLQYSGTNHHLLGTGPMFEACSQNVESTINGIFSLTFSSTFLPEGFILVFGNFACTDNVSPLCFIKKAQIICRYLVQKNDLYRFYINSLFLFH